MITSISNGKIKHVTQLLTKSKVRKQEGLYVIEGEKMFAEAPKELISEVYASTSFLSKTSNMARLNEVGYEEVTDSVYERMSDTKSPQGILCVMRKKNLKEDFILNLAKKDKAHILVLEGLQDPGNMGTIMRTAEGAGYDCILADDKTVDIYNPKVIRSTMGAMFRMPVVYTSELNRTLDKIRENGIKVYAAHLSGKNNYCDESYPDKMAILIGNEGNGLTDEIMKHADVPVRIPMEGNVESLNASVAAAILMYHSYYVGKR